MIWKIIFGFWLLAAVVEDLNTYKIPNWLCVCVALSGYVIQGIRFGVYGILDGCYGMMIGFLILFGFFVIQVLGAGDVKLLCSAGAFVGHGIWKVLLYFCVISGIAAVGKLVCIVVKKRSGKDDFSVPKMRKLTKMHMSVPILLANLLYLTGGRYGI